MNNSFSTHVRHQIVELHRGQRHRVDSSVDYMAKVMHSLSTSAAAQLRAELAFAEQRVDEALALQAQAVAAAADADDTEPPMLASGLRQRLGGMQLRAKHFAAAEQSFRTDLASHPASGWALGRRRLPARF